MSSCRPKPKILVIVGPTASGKSALAVTLAKKFNGEIVSADSRQVYRGMDIGTGKITRKEMGGIPHHLIDIKNPDEEYTVAEYKRDAIAAIAKILRAKKLPILVGGTGLYVRAVVENLDIPKAAADPKLRAATETEIKEEGLAAVFKKLVALDPEAAVAVDGKNPRRVLRALEVILATGKPFTSGQRKGEPLFDARVLGIGAEAGNARNTADRAEPLLRKRIDARVDQMMRNGLLEEVKMLVKKYGAECRVLDTIGYREIAEYLKAGGANHSLDRAVAHIKLDTWHYAKRQMTWFKKYGGAQWIKNPREATQVVEEFLMKRK